MRKKSLKRENDEDVLVSREDGKFPTNGCRLYVHLGHSARENDSTETSLSLCLVLSSRLQEFLVERGRYAHV